MTTSTAMVPAAADPAMTETFNDDCVVPSEAGCVADLIDDTEAVL